MQKVVIHIKGDAPKEKSKKICMDGYPEKYSLQHCTSILLDNSIPIDTQQAEK